MVLVITNMEVWGSEIIKMQMIL